MPLKRCFHCDVALYSHNVMPSRRLEWWGCAKCGSIFGYNEEGELKSLWERRRSSRIMDVPEGSLAVME